MPIRRVVVAVAAVAVVVGALSALLFGDLLSSRPGQAEEQTKALEAPETRPAPEVAQRTSEPRQTTPVEDTSSGVPQPTAEAKVEAAQSQASGGPQAVEPAPQQTEETQAETQTATAAPPPGESGSVALYTDVEAPSSKESGSVTPDGRNLEIITVLPKDGILAIFEPELVTASEYMAHTPQEQLVMGVSVNGDHRAYSIAYLSGREIVNDVVGGVPVAVTW